MRKLLIIGAGGHGKVVADVASQMQIWDTIAFLDDLYPKLKQVSNWPVLDVISQAANFQSQTNEVSIAIGNNAMRLKLYEQLKAIGFKFPLILHSSAVLSSQVQIGEGSVILANTVINIAADIGKMAIINTGAIVEHDCKLGDGVHVSPQACLAGGVKVNQQSWIGLGARVIENIQIGSKVIVGAGAVVINDLADNVTAVGVPARVINEKRV